MKKAKLAVVVDTFPRWSERFIARELNELRRRGVEFTVFCLKAGSFKPENGSEWDGLLERCAVLSGYTKAGRVRSLCEALRSGGFTHLHAHFANLPSTVAWLAAKDANVPFSIAVHARDLFVEAQQLEQKVADCQKVFVCHRRAREFLASKTVPQDKIVLMRHGLPLERFPFQMRSRFRAERAVRILAAGRFVAKKGFSDLITALDTSSLRERDDEVMLLGDGPERAALQKQIRSAGMQRIARLQPPLSGPALREAFESSDLFVAPYTTAEDGDNDGVPNVILEAFALGLPVLGTSAGSMAEVLTAETGTIMPQRNPRALSAALKDFIDHPASAWSKTATARRLVEEQYDVRKNIALLLELIGANVGAC